MTASEFIAHVRLKPNCDLENTRASLVLRRITRLCDTATSYPDNIAADMNAAAYVCEHGFYLRFVSPIPEQVLSVINSCFFVESCRLVRDESTIPTYLTPQNNLDCPEEPATDALATSFLHEGEHDDEFMGILVKFDDIIRSFSQYAAEHEQDRTLSDLSYQLTQMADTLRTAIAFSRLEPFSRIVTRLRKAIEEYAQQFNANVNLNIYENHAEIDRVVLASMEEILKRLAKMCLRISLKHSEERKAAGKPDEISISIRIEFEGATITCRSEHNGHAFDARSVGLMAQARGMLTRPLETYTEEELGSLALLPHFLGSTRQDRMGDLYEMSEIGTILQRVGGSGSIRNTKQGTVETVLTFPITFIALDVVLITINDAPIALPATQIKRFEAFDKSRVSFKKNGPAYEDEEGAAHTLINEAHTPTPLATNEPRIAVFLDVQGKNTVLGVDSVEGYEHAVIGPLPPTIGHHLEKAIGGVGYLVHDDGMIRTVISARHLLQAIPFTEEAS